MNPNPSSVDSVKIGSLKVLSDAPECRPYDGDNIGATIFVVLFGVPVLCVIFLGVIAAPWG